MQNKVDIILNKAVSLSASRNETWIYLKQKNKLNFWANITVFTGTGFDVFLEIPSDTFANAIEVVKIGTIDAIGKFLFEANVLGFNYIRIKLVKIGTTQFSGNYGVVA